MNLINNLRPKSRKFISSRVAAPEISIAIILQVRPNVNSLTFDSIKSFQRIKTVKSSKKYISIPDKSLKQIEKLVKNFKDIELIIQPNSISLRSKPKFITSKFEEDYIMIVHDDDLYSSQLILHSIEFIKKYKPISLALHTTQINEDLKLFERRRSNNSRRIKKLSPNMILARYFLPFEKALFYPAIIFKRTAFIKYWEENLLPIGSHEDVKINFYMAKKGVFLEWENPNLYFYRVHQSQDSNRWNEFDRLRLIAWLKNLKINFIYKTIFLLSSKLQYLIFYKKIETRISFLTKILLKLRISLIKYRTGGKALEELNSKNYS